MSVRRAYLSPAGLHRRPSFSLLCTTSAKIYSKSQARSPSNFSIYSLPHKTCTKLEDVAVAARYQNFLLGIMLSPVFLGEQYPESALDSPEFGLTPLTDDEVGYINGTSDVYAINPYKA